ncbi:MAG: hypothetical protein ACRDV2_10200, partial [Actinomycetes bacterium]
GQAGAMQSLPAYSTAFGPEPFTGPEAVRTGLGRDPLRALVATGRVRRVLRGVFVDACVPDTLELSARAVAKVVPPGTVICGRTAAWIWGVDALAMGAHLRPRLDMGWRCDLKGLEFDGDAAHGTAEQQAWDRVRRGRAEDCGWGIAVVTTEQVMGRSLAFEHGIEELLGREMRLTRNHPRLGGWDSRSRWAA